MSLVLVLSTLNTSTIDPIDADTLTLCLMHHDYAKLFPAHMSVFFGEVSPSMQWGVASGLGITLEQLRSAAKAFSDYSGDLGCLPYVESAYTTFPGAPYADKCG